MGKPNNEPSKNLFMKLPNIIAKSREFINWFSPSHAPYPANESGDIMRRAMANNSWFDQISSSWESRSFWNKAATLIGLTLFSGVIGLFLNAPLYSLFQLD